MFCQVRDMPLAYVTKADYQRDKQEMSQQIEKMNNKLDKLVWHLLGEKPEK
jgi:hypothetical protein